MLNLHVTGNSGELAYLSNESIACAVTLSHCFRRLEQLFANLPRCGMRRTVGVRAAC